MRRALILVSLLVACREAPKEHVETKAEKPAKSDDSKQSEADDDDPPKTKQKKHETAEAPDETAKTDEPKSDPEQVALVPVKLALAGHSTLHASRPSALKETPCGPRALEIASVEGDVAAPTIRVTKCFAGDGVELAIAGEWWVATKQDDPEGDLFAKRSKGSTLKRKTGDTFVTSGFVGDRIRYEKHLFVMGASDGYGPNTTDWHHAAYIVVYDKAHKAAYDKPIEAMNAALSFAQK